MWDFIKYLPLECRRRHNYCTPAGPSISKVEKVKCNAGGNHLRFMAPPHSPTSRVGYTEIRPYSDRDELAELLHRYSDDVMSNRYWEFRTVFSRCWAFWGPWMTGAKAQLFMSVSVVGRNEEHEYQGASFLHPSVFENVLVDYLNARYGHKGIDVGSPRRGPLDWKPFNEMPVPAVSFKVVEVSSDGRAVDPENLIFIPVTPKHFLRICFTRKAYSLDESGEPYFDTSPVDSLQESIVNSIQLELGPETQAEWNRVAADCPEMSLTERFAPLKWPIDSDSQESAVEDAPDRLKLA